MAGMLPPCWAWRVEDGPHAGQVRVAAVGPSGTTCQAVTTLEGVQAAAVYVAGMCWRDPGPFLPVEPAEGW